MTNDEPTCTTPGACYRRHVAGCPRFVPLSTRTARELETQGWSLDIAEPTEADKAARRSPPITLYVKDVHGGFMVSEEDLRSMPSPLQPLEDMRTANAIAKQNKADLARNFVMATQGYSARKPHLRLRVKLGKHSGMPYWAVLPVECDISMVSQWQVTDAAAMARAKQLMGLGLPVR